MRIVVIILIFVSYISKAQQVYMNFHSGKAIPLNQYFIIDDLAPLLPYDDYGSLNLEIKEKRNYISIGITTVNLTLFRAGGIGGLINWIHNTVPEGENPSVGFIPYFHNYYAASLNYKRSLYRTKYNMEILAGAGCNISSAVFTIVDTVYYNPFSFEKYFTKYKYDKRTFLIPSISIGVRKYFFKDRFYINWAFKPSYIKGFSGIGFNELGLGVLLFDKTKRNNLAKK